MLPSKRATMSSALDQPGEVGSVMMLFVIEYPGVSVPEAFADKSEDGTLWLRYSHRFQTHLNLKQEGVEADLSTNGTTYRTFVPWGAVLLVAEESTGTQVFWPFEEPGPPEEPKAAPPSVRSHLRLVPTEGDPPS